MRKNLNALAHLTRLVRLSCVTSLLLTATLGHAQVGLRKMVSGDMPITVIYPTASAVQPITQGPFTIQAAKDAAPLPAPPGSRRLIVFSHGTAGSTYNDHDLAATLARAGFVVAQPLHRGDNFKDFSHAGPDSWPTRAVDVTQTINALAQDPVLGQQLDLQHVGLHGMSAGGGTGIMMAGGQWRLLTLVQHCAQHLNEDIGFCLNGLAGHPFQQALRKVQFALSRLFLTEDNAPASMKMLQGGQNPSQSQDPRPDPRITAVSLVVPLGAIFTTESLARIRIPVALTTAGNDGVLVPRFHSDKILQYCTRCTRLSDHPIAGHFDWLSPWPASVATAVASSQTRGGLPNPNFSPEERQKAFDLIALFFKQKL
jgi:predicted dienelactone hydrolase